MRGRASDAWKFQTSKEFALIRPLAALLLALFALLPAQLLADCTSPAAIAGKLIYNSTFNLLQYCNGTNWVNTGSSGNSSQIGTLTSSNYCNTDGTVVNCTTSSIPVAGGGTGATTLTLNGVLYGNGTSAVQTTAQGAANSVLTANASAPSFSASPTIGTSVTTPLVIGGTGTTSTLTMRATSGVGTTNSDIIFQIGNNGATEAARILNSGNVGIGTSAPDQKLTVAGTIESTTGGVKYPDGTTQTTAYTGAGGSRLKVILEDQQTSGTNGGTFSSGSWVTRVLNTKVYDGDSICTLSSNRFTLPAGTYYIKWSAPATYVERHQSMLYDVTNSAVKGYGQSMRGDYGSGFISTTLSSGAAVVTIAGSTTYEIRHQSWTTVNFYGLGVSAGVGTEIYTHVEIWSR